MKRYFLFLISILLFSVDNSYGEDNKNIIVEIGSFKTAGRKHKVYAEMSSDTSKVYSYSIEMEYASIMKLNNPMAHLAYTDSLYFILQRIGNKYKEWTNVAKDNKVDKIKKEMPIPFPIKMITQENKNFRTGKINIIESKPTSNTFTFNLYNPEKNPSLFYKAKYTSKGRFGGVNYEMVLLFLSLDEYNTFLKLFNTSTLKERINQKNYTEELFK